MRFGGVGGLNNAGAMLTIFHPRLSLHRHLDYGALIFNCQE
jgi:hypothetical protein